MVTTTPALNVYTSELDEPIASPSRRDSDSDSCRSSKKQKAEAYASYDALELHDEESTSLTSIVLYDNKGHRCQLGELLFRFSEDELWPHDVITLPTEADVCEDFCDFPLWNNLHTNPATPFKYVTFFPSRLKEDGFYDLAGYLWKTRKSAKIHVSNDWEIHFVVLSSPFERGNDSTHYSTEMVAYACPLNHLYDKAREEGEELLNSKKMAVGLDIDCTLVKCVRSEDALQKYNAERVHFLPMFLETDRDWVVVLASEVREFLKKASKKFRISLYSVGTVEYVQQIGQLLDPDHNIFDWVPIDSGAASARHEREQNLEISPKRFERIFSFCHELDYAVCIGVDDNQHVWAEECRSRILKVEEAEDESGIWDAKLLDVWQEMKKLHRQFFSSSSAVTTPDENSVEEQEPDSIN